MARNYYSYNNSPQFRYLENQRYGENPTGNLFEEDAINIIQNKYDKTSIKNMTGTLDDTHQGTDVICFGIRMDMTIDFDKKLDQWTPCVIDTGIDSGIPGQNFKMAIRHGNTHKGYSEFKEPVVAFGIATDASTYVRYEDEVLESVKKNAQAIMDLAADCYFDYTTPDFEEREDNNTPSILLPNKFYNPPRSLSETYREYNNGQKDKWEKLGVQIPNNWRAEPGPKPLKDRLNDKVRTKAETSNDISNQNKGADMTGPSNK